MTRTTPVAESSPATLNKLLCRALARQVLPRPPFWFMRQAGRYLPEYREVREKAGSFLDFCYSPELACEATLQPVRRFGTDAAIVFSDILVIPDALGQAVDFLPQKGPILEPIRSVGDIEALSPGRVRDHLDPVYETLRRARGALPQGVALIGFAGAPWTVACYMVEGSAPWELTCARAWARDRPAETQTLISILIEATATHLIAQADAGAEVLQLFDTWAGALTAAEFERWSIAPTAELVRRIREPHPEVPIIGFPNKVGRLYAAYAERTGVDAVSIDSTVPLQWAANELQPHCPVQGNLDPYLLVSGGKPLRDEAQRILSVLGRGPFVFNLGHGVLPQTPPEHVSELADIIRDWSS